MRDIDYLLGHGLMEEDVEIEDELRIPLVRVPTLVRQEARTTIMSIQQGFICKPNDSVDVRVRKSSAMMELRGTWVAASETTYTMTTKFRPLKQEAEMEISEEMFNELWAAAISKQGKLRYCWNGWDIDEFDDGTVVAEYERGEGERVTIPVCFEPK